jgi:hypothetical protein
MKAKTRGKALDLKERALRSHNTFPFVCSESKKDDDASIEEFEVERIPRTRYFEEAAQQEQGVTEPPMQQPPSFHQILHNVIERATVRHLQATGHLLSLQIIAHDVGLDVTSLQLILRGKALLERSYLLPLLVYLGCDEPEQRFIFHLAEIAADEINPRSNPLKSFQQRNDADPARTTHKQP